VPKTIDALNSCEPLSEKIIEQKAAVINLIKSRLESLTKDKIEIDATTNMNSLTQSSSAIIKMQVVDARQETLLLPYQLREYNTVFTFKPLVDTTNFKSKTIPKKQITRIINSETLESKQEPLMSSMVTSTIDNKNNHKLELAMQEIKNLAKSTTLKTSNNTDGNTAKSIMISDHVSNSSNDSKVIVDNDTEKDMDIDDDNNSQTMTTNTTSVFPGIEVIEELPQSIAEKYQLSAKKNKINDKKRKTATGDNDIDKDNTSATFTYPTIDIGAISSNNDIANTNATNTFNKNKKNKNKLVSRKSSYLDFKMLEIHVG
jgi:hypothetical protein